MRIVLGGLFLFNFVVFLSIEYHVFIKTHRIRAITYVRLVYLFLYGLVPGVLLLMMHDGPIFGTIDYSTEGIFYLTIFYICTWIGYVFLNLGYRLNIRIKKKKFAENVLEENLQKKLMYRVSIIGLIIGTISLFLWSNAYGSIWGLIEVASRVRSGVSPVYNPFTFFKHPASILTVVSIVFFSLVFSTEYRKKIIFKLCLTLSIFLSCLFLIACDGRTAIALYLLQYVLIFMYCRNKEVKFELNTLIKLACLAILLLILILNLDVITSYIRTGHINGTWRIYDSFIGIIESFEHTALSGQFVLQNRFDIGIRYMFIDDVITGIFAWLPTAFKPDGFITTWEYNTQLITNGANSGTLPCDIITHSIYDFGIVGVVIVPFLFGVFVKKIEEMRINANDKFINCIYVIFIPVVISSVTALSLYNFILGIFDISVVCIIYVIMKQTMFARTAPVKRKELNDT